MTTDPFVKPASDNSRRRRRRIAAMGCVLALGLGVGASQAQAVSRSGAQSESTGSGSRTAAFHGPPNVRLTNGSTTLSMHPYSACWSSDHQGVCYDGSPPNPLPSLGGTTSTVHLAFPRDGWHFQVTATDAQGHEYRVKLIAEGTQEWRLNLSARADGTYRLDIFGRGSQGDVAAAAALTLT